jgi:hypothetical protein
MDDAKNTLGTHAAYYYSLILCDLDILVLLNNVKRVNLISLNLIFLELASISLGNPEINYNLCQFTTLMLVGSICT